MSIRLPIAPPSTRREFCASACRAASLAVAGTFVGCGGSPTSPSTSAPQLSSVAGTLAGRTISVTLAAASALASVGSAALVQTSLGTFLVARTGQDSFSALTAVCTHDMCTVTGFESNQFVCPCHGSRYTTAGAVANGPAPRPLQQYATQVSDGVLTFTV